MPIIIGLGTGRSGTQSLAQLLNMQPGTVCFHETNPSCVKWKDTPRTVLSMIDEFEAVLAGGPREITIDFTRPAKDDGLDRLRDLPDVSCIGDVASYYLSYAPMLLELQKDIRMPCIERRRDEVVKSFAKAVRVRRQRKSRSGLRGLFGTPEQAVKSRNHWVEHDGSHWRLDPKWDKLFPKFDAATLEEAIGMYWDYYAEETRRLAAAHPDHVKVFGIEALNSEEGQRAILDFCGADGPHVLSEIHANAMPD